MVWEVVMGFPWLGLCFWCHDSFTPERPGESQKPVEWYDAKPFHPDCLVYYRKYLEELKKQTEELKRQIRKEQI